jgi:hypothetical protein
MKSNKNMSRQESNEPSILTYIDKSTNDNLKKLFEKITPGDEFELIFFGRKGSFLQQDKYIKLLQYLSKFAELNNLHFMEPYNILDVNYNIDRDNTVRCTISEHENINRIMKKLNIPKNHVVFKTLVEMYFNSSSKPLGISFMKKEKENENVVDVGDFDFRARLSHEVDLTKSDIKHCLQIDETYMNKTSIKSKLETAYLNEFLKKNVFFRERAVDSNGVVKNYKIKIINLAKFYKLF